MKFILRRAREAVSRRQTLWAQAKALAPHLPQLHAAFAGRDAHPLTHSERELLENALAFGALTADDVAVPRADIKAVEETATLPEVLAQFAESHHSRLPVIGETLDDLKGFVLLKDAIAHLEKPEAFNLKTMLRPLTVVPETMPLPRVLQHMKRAKVPFVLVTDEFGGTSGLISLKDILEQLVGNIADESAPQAEAMVSLGGGRYRVRGETPLADLDRVLGTNLDTHEDVDVTTLAGLVMKTAQHIPILGEKITLPHNLSAEVTDTDGRRLLLLTLTLPKAKV